MDNSPLNQVCVQVMKVTGDASEFVTLSLLTDFINSDICVFIPYFIIENVQKQQKI